ncbi:MAG: FeoB-associated Cys-rich membrane protein [Clostridia bacterium]|nr:FeoB-associated Cys-rich membrane protein [Clostridia bacterium]
MLEFIKLYGGTVLVSAIVITVITLAILKIVKRRKNGNCSFGCETCAFKDNCHKKD